MNRKIRETIIMTVISLFFLCVIIMMLIVLIDLPTIKNLGTKKVKCIDDKGAEFIDEWCKKEISCSWLGVFGEGKCKDIDKSEYLVISLRELAGGGK